MPQGDIGLQEKLMKFSSRTLNWIIIVYWTIILLVSVVSLNGSIAVNKSRVFGLRSDYLWHVLLFIPWMILAKWRWQGVHKRNLFWFLFGGGIIFAVISEVIQIIVPGRTFNLIDMAANCLGIVVGVLISGRGRSKQVISSS